MVRKVKGLEPIVAAVLLIVVAVIGAVLIYLWFSGYVTKATSQAEQMTASEKLKIEAANLTTTGGVTVYVRNLGGVPVDITSIYVFQPGTISPLCTTTIQHNIEPGVVSKLDAQLQCTLNKGRDYVVKFVTSRGTETAVTVSAT